MPLEASHPVLEQRWEDLRAGPFSVPSVHHFVLHLRWKHSWLSVRESAKVSVLTWT
jgi:hypothetical protein